MPKSVSFPNPGKEQTSKGRSCFARSLMSLFISTLGFLSGFLSILFFLLLKIFFGVFHIPADAMGAILMTLGALSEQGKITRINVVHGYQLLSLVSTVYHIIGKMSIGKIKKFLDIFLYNYILFQMLLATTNGEQPRIFDPRPRQSEFLALLRPSEAGSLLAHPVPSSASQVYYL